MPSGSFSVGGTWMIASFVRLVPDSAPVTSLEAGCGAVAGTGGISTEAELPELAAGAGAALFWDCRPIGVGEVIDGVTCSGVAGLFSTGGGACGAGAGDEFSIACGDGDGLLPSSRFIATLKVPGHITTHPPPPRS